VRVLITGANGQVGRELLRAAWPNDTTVAGFTSTQLDITDPASIASVIADLAPDVIVNAAAYTNVDRAEDEPDRAMLVNSTAVGHLSAAADTGGALLVHISTDYVFDGAKEGWYNEDDVIAPVGVYGSSKAAGEVAALGAERSLVLRTAWVYGALGSNFVTTMLRLAAERDELGVVADQFGCPTSAADLAATIVALVELEATTSLSHRLFHVAAPDDTSWHGFAQEIFEISAAGFGGKCNQLTTADYPTKATRPANSRLATDRLTAMLGQPLPSWRDSLSLVVSELEANAASGTD
jgi:dTDP-4-dehydrorhamnose reductase